MAMGRGPESYGGLSPRLRGNRPVAVFTGITGLRSIPAPAGEPIGQRRTCGRKAWGLSPRLRGNHGVPPSGVASRVYPRACGGTKSLASGLPWPTVYPRACGGTIYRAT